MRQVIEMHSNLGSLADKYDELDAVCAEIASRFLEHEDNVLVISADGNESVTEDYGDADIARSLAGSIILLSQLGVQFSMSIER